jgi:hypothetical protein
LHLFSSAIAIVAAVAVVAAIAVVAVAAVVSVLIASIFFTILA